MFREDGQAALPKFLNPNIFLKRKGGSALIEYVIKRDGRKQKFDRDKIETAISKAVTAIGGSDFKRVSQITSCVVDELNKLNGEVSVEDVQDMVEKVLIKMGCDRTAKEFIIYRHKRSQVREMNMKLMSTFRDLTFKDSKDNDLKRENANINANTAMGTMLKYGSESAKTFVKLFMLRSEHARLHEEGWIHIHDLDFYPLTTTCCQIDLTKLFTEGFSTGHGYIREPNSIRTYASLACIAIQANQNEQHGGQSVPKFDYDMAPGVAKSFSKNFKEVLIIRGYDDRGVRKALMDAYRRKGTIIHEVSTIHNIIMGRYTGMSEIEFNKIYNHAVRMTEDEVKQGMEAVVHNLNTMHSRAGAQIPFSSLNYGTCTSEEGRLVMHKLLDATLDGLGFGETPVFPIQIFKVKDGVNTKEGDPNYDLFLKSLYVSAKRLFPCFSFLDAPFNAEFYIPGRPETEIAYMGCRTRVMANVHDPDKQIVCGRGNLSFTSINLPRLAIESGGDLGKFFHSLKQMTRNVLHQLEERYNIQAKKKAKNYPFMMEQGVWLDSDFLDPEDEVGEVLKHGTLTVGFIGLAECLKCLTGFHHGESEESQRLGLRIVSTMRDLCDEKMKRTKMNYSLIATPAEGLSGRFLRLDREKYGIIEGVTDREYYTNSFHVPVYYDISAFKKIRLEAPYHTLTNGGHITYVEFDGDPSNNVEAMKDVVLYMKEQGIGYGSINHPVDRCPVCGFTGVINDRCPKCGRKEFEGVDEDVLRSLGVEVRKKGVDYYEPTGTSQGD